MNKWRWFLNTKFTFVLRFMIHLIILLCVGVLVSMAYYTNIDMETLVALQLKYIWITTGVALLITWIVRKF